MVRVLLPMPDLLETTVLKLAIWMTAGPKCGNSARKGNNNVKYTNNNLNPTHHNKYFVTYHLFSACLQWVPRGQNSSSQLWDTAKSLGEKLGL